MVLNTPARTFQPVRRRVVVGAAAACLGLGAALGAGLAPVANAAEAPANGSAPLTGIILGVGADESQRIVSWYSSVDTPQQVQVAPTAQLVDGELPAGATTFDALGDANIAASGGYNRHATITGLAENTEYSYRVGAEGMWSPTYEFETQSFEGEFDFLFLGDPQIGSSGDKVLDGDGWEASLGVAVEANPDAELLVSGGDQVEHAGNEEEWTQFLRPDALREYPWAATIGNHDVGSKAYEQHLFTPNTDRSASLYHTGDPDSNTSGGDYWFIYKDVLFIDFNSNSYSTDEQDGGGDEAHINYITDVIEEHGDEAKYTVLVSHHAIYSPAAHAKDDDNKIRRGDFPQVFSNLGVDLVLQGHDHSYSRSYLIKNDKKANQNEQPGQPEVAAGPGGVLYVQANSASGSKYYDLTSPDNTPSSGTGNGPDPLNLDNYWYNSVQNQEHVPTYVRVQVRKDQLVVESLRSGTCDANNPAVQRGNVDWCGPDSGASPAKPIGTVQDSVVFRPYHGDGQRIQVDVPQSGSGEFGWTIDGRNGLVDLGTAEDMNDHREAIGGINPIVVKDTRSSQAPWSISASVGDFQDGSKTFGARYLGWTPKLVEEGAGAKAGAPIPSGYDVGEGLSASRTLGQAEEGHPLGSATLGADLTLKIPDTIEPGAYRATLTITALSG